MSGRSAQFLLVVLAMIAPVAGGCGGDDGGGGGASGRVVADGSSTVGPFATAAAQRYREVNPDVQVTVGISGTGGGFERFCAGETDLSNASRPIDEEERQACTSNGVEFVEFTVANDGIALVANAENTWAKCLTVDQLKTIWAPDSEVDNWRDVDPSFPDETLRLFGPGTDSGTFDFFTEAVVGKEGSSRSDYQASENDNVIVSGIAGTKGGLGYFGLSYFEDNQDQLKALQIDGGDGCITPTAETVQNGQYEPLSRPLFIYAKQSSFEREQVQAFLRYVLENEREIAEASRFVPLTDEQLEQARQALDKAIEDAGAA